MNHQYLDKVLKALPSGLKAEICSTGGGYYSIIIPFDQYQIDIPAESGGACLYDNQGNFVMILTNETNPRKLAKIVTDLYLINFTVKA